MTSAKILLRRLAIFLLLNAVILVVLGGIGLVGMAEVSLVFLISLVLTIMAERQIAKRHRKPSPETQG